MSKASERIVKGGLLTEFEGRFLEKSRDYGDGHEFLGVRGQFSDMNRKFQKLKRFMWDNPDEEPVNESLEEILFDMIGHCFLTIDLLRQGQYEDPFPGNTVVRMINEIMNSDDGSGWKVRAIEEALKEAGLR